MLADVGTPLEEGMGCAALRNALRRFRRRRRVLSLGTSARPNRHAYVYFTCVYRQLKHGRSGDEVRPGWRELITPVR
jgi:hypothetical protein